MGAAISAMSDGIATGLIFAAGAGGSFALVLGLTVFSVRRDSRVARRAAQAAAPPASGPETLGGGDGYPPQPYSSAEPKSHQPYSRPYTVPRQDGSQNHANGKRPSGSTGLPTAPWPPPEE